MIARERIENFAAKLDALAQRWSRDRDVAAAFLHGSRGRGAARAQSDVDLAVVLRKELSASERWRKRLGLLEAATSQLGTDAVDLVILEEAPAALAHRAIRDGRLILDSDPRRRVEVVENVFRRYLDEAWLRQMLDEGLRTRLAEGRFAR
jgi:predicted nucleotidyltransferase